MAIEWAQSTEKHGISRGDALYAMTHSVFTSSRVDVPKGRPALPRRLFVGPPHGQTTRLLEVLVENRSGGVMFVYHVANLGLLYRRLMEGKA
jgi:hypothetical protein